MSAAYRLPGTLESLDEATAALWDAGCTGIVQDAGEIVAYFERRLPDETPLPGGGRWEDVDDVDWLERYYEGLEPVRCGRVVVAPTHARPETSEGDVTLWLDPGMAFGTGHHETTRMALEALGDVPLEGRRVLDVGAGSGILAIAADLLGAGEAFGIDIDPQTVPAAEANARRNDSRARFAAGTTYRSVDDASCDVLVANLYAELHVELVREYARVLAAEGVLLVTGILADRRALVEGALLRAGFVLRGQRQEGDWVLLHAARADEAGPE